MRFLLPLLALLLPAAEPPPPRAPASPAVLTLVAPDLRASLATADDLAAQHLGRAPGALMTDLGAAIGDPSLAGLDHGVALIAVLPAQPLPGVALALPVTTPAPYEAALARWAPFLDQHGRWLLAATTPEAATLARTLVDAPAEADAPSLRLALAGERAAASFAPTLASLLPLLVHQATPAQRDGLVTAQQVLLAGIAQTAVLQLDLDLDRDGIGAELSLAANGALAQALATPPAAPDRRGHLAADPAPLTAAGRLPAAVLTWLADAGRGTIQGETWAALLRPAAASWDGSLAVRVGPDPLARISRELVAGVRDPAQAKLAVAAFRRVLSAGPGQQLLEPAMTGGELVPVLQWMSRRIGSTVADRLDWELTPGAVPPEREAQIRAKLRGIEWAADDRIFAWSEAVGGLDRLIGPTALPVRPTAAPADHDFLAGIDFPVLRGRGGAPATATLGLTTGDGRLRIQVRLPAAALGAWGPRDAAAPPVPERPEL